MNVLHRPVESATPFQPFGKDLFLGDSTRKKPRHEGGVLIEGDRAPSVPEDESSIIPVPPMY
jgi:hypothetical protein